MKKITLHQLLFLSTFSLIKYDPINAMKTPGTDLATLQSAPKKIKLSELVANETKATQQTPVINFQYYQNSHTNQISIRIGDRPYSCDKCKTLFYKLSQLHNHIHNHKEAEEYSDFNSGQSDNDISE